MLTLCVCDDDSQEAAAIRALAESFAAEHREFPLRVEHFSSPLDLLDCLERRGGFDVYLLDIVMPQMEGVELARRIRERGDAAEILFLTTSREYALEAFGVSACGYLLKPIDKGEFGKALLSAVSRLTQPANPFFWLKTREGLKKILFRDLIAVESFNHDRVCYLTDRTTVTTGDTLSSLMERLSVDKRFFSPHRAYIVNLEHIIALDTTSVTLTTGKRVPVARTSVVLMKEAYLRYLF